jgi:hypothetical protein
MGLHGTTFIMLSGSGDGQISAQLWLEALKAELGQLVGLLNSIHR